MRCELSRHIIGPYGLFKDVAAFAKLDLVEIAAALALGWLSPAGGPGQLQLSRQGRRALKREISAASAPDRNPRSPAACAPKARTPAATARGPQRLEGPLQWLRNRKDQRGQPLITQAQYEAGTRFAADYVKGQMQPRTTASWSLTAPCLRKGTPGGGVDISDAALAARNRFHAAMDAVGPEMGQLLTEVCCHDIGLESAERARRWPIRSGKVVLDMALTCLARHYGLEPTPKAAGDAAPPSRPRARRWADPAFTPTLAGWNADPAAAASQDADATACA